MKRSGKFFGKLILFSFLTVILGSNIHPVLHSDEAHCLVSENHFHEHPPACDFCDLIAHLESGNLNFQDAFFYPDFSTVLFQTVESPVFAFHGTGILLRGPPIPKA